MEVAATTPKGTVCVTGAAGFVGSWLVMRLLERGYVVRATVRSLGDPNKLNVLQELPNASTNLSIWKADLSEEGSFDKAIQGCDGVFHVATPMDFESKDPVVSFSSKKLMGMGFQYKYTLEDMFAGAIDTCREKRLIPRSTQIHENVKEKNSLVAI